MRQKDPCFIEAGDVDPNKLLFTRDRLGEVRDAVPKAYETIRTLDDQCADTAGTRSVAIGRLDESR